MKRRVTDYWLYRSRHAIGAVVGFLVVATLLVIAMWIVPGGLRDAERMSALSADAIEFSPFQPESVIALPYHLLQALSLMALGATPFAIKLPSLLLALATLVGIYLLLAEWFHRNVALITAFIMTTLPVFLFMAQDGTWPIAATALSTWMLLSAASISRRREPKLLWKTLFLSLAVLSLYFPLGIYLIIAVFVTIVSHPHIRFMVRRLNPNYVAFAGGIGFLLLAPLLYSLSVKPTLALDLLGVSDLSISFPDTFTTFASLVMLPLSEQSSGIFLTPIFSLGVIALLFLGVYRFFLIKYTARNYIISTWVVLLLIFCVLNPEYTPLLWLPFGLIVAMGVNGLIRDWYRLFPRNPYARIAGLVPLTIIVAGITLTSIVSFANGFSYQPAIARNYTDDERLLDKTLESAKASKENKAQLLAPANIARYYRLVAAHDERFDVVTDSSAVTPDHAAIVMHGQSLPEGRVPHYIAANSLKADSNRFTLYTPTKK